MGVVNRFVGFYDNQAYDAGSRPRQGSGVTVEGCENVEVHRNRIERSSAAGIRVGSSGFWSTSRAVEVDVRWNSLFGAAQDSNWPALSVFAEYQDVWNIHVRDNTIEYPNSTIAIKVAGGAGRYVHDSQVENNTVTGSVQDCLFVDPFTTYIISIFGNTYNGGVCQ